MGLPTILPVHPHCYPPHAIFDDVHRPKNPTSRASCQRSMTIHRPSIKLSDLSLLLSRPSKQKFKLSGPQRTPTVFPGLLPSDSFNQGPGKFSGFRGVSHRILLAWLQLSCNQYVDRNLRWTDQLGGTRVCSQRVFNGGRNENDGEGAHFILPRRITAAPNCVLLSEPDPSGKGGPEQDRSHRVLGPSI